MVPWLRIKGSTGSTYQDEAAMEDISQMRFLQRFGDEKEIAIWRPRGIAVKAEKKGSAKALRMKNIGCVWLIDHLDL